MNTCYDTLVADLRQSFREHKQSWEDSKVRYDAQLKQSLKSMEGIQDMSSCEIVDEYSKLIRKAEETKPLATRQKKLKDRLGEAVSNIATLIENYRTA